MFLLSLGDGGDEEGCLRRKVAEKSHPLEGEIPKFRNSYSVEIHEKSLAVAGGQRQPSLVLKWDFTVDR